MQTETIVQERGSSHFGLLGTGIATGLIGLNVTMLPWLVSTLLNWSTGGTIENNYFYFLLLALFICPLAVAIMVRLVKVSVFLKVLKGALIHVGLAGQLVINWLIYSRFHGLFPFGITQEIIDGAPLLTGWLSTDVVPVALFAIWAGWTLLFVVPCLFGYLVASNPPGKDFKPGLHLGFAIMGFSLGLRWGGPWSAMFNQLVIVACLFPVMALALSKTRLDEPARERRHFPIFSTIGIMALLGFWFSITLSHSGTQLGTTWTWLAFAGSNVALFVLSLKVTSWDKRPAGKITILVAWGALVVFTVFLLLAGLNSWFSWLLLAWTSAGLALVSFSPELLACKQVIARKPMGARVFFFALLVILGVVLSYLINISDPLSTYLAFVIIGLFFAMSFFTFTKPKDWGRSDKVYGIAAIITSATLLLAPFGLLLGITSMIRKERAVVKVLSLIIGIVMTVAFVAVLVVFADDIAGLF